MILVGPLQPSRLCAFPLTRLPRGAAPPRQGRTPGSRCPRRLGPSVPAPLCPGPAPAVTPARRAAALETRFPPRAGLWESGKGPPGEKMAAQGRARAGGGGGGEECGSGRSEAELLLLHPELLSEEFLRLTLEQVRPGSRAGRSGGP